MQKNNNQVFLWYSKTLTMKQNTLRIYLADDDSEDKVIFAETLKETLISAELISFDDGISLTHYLQTEKQKPDIIFLDLNMPGKSGKQCLKEIRDNFDYNHIPVVIFTVTSYLKDIIDTYAFGANLYMPKNVFIKNNVEALTMILQTVLKDGDQIPSKEKFVVGDSSVFKRI